MKTKRLIFVSIGLAAFFFASIGFYVRREKRPMQEERLRVGIDMMAVRPVLAASSNWDGVRSLATFIKDVTEGVDRIIVNLTNSGLLNATNQFTHNDGTYKILFAPNSNTTITPRASGASTTYSHKFILWRASDNTKMLELFFDSPSNRTSGDGVAVVWWPKLFDSTLSSTSGKIECVTSESGSNKAMVCSWSQGPFNTSGVVTEAQLKALSNSTNGTVDVKAVARLNSTGSTTCSGGNTDYYALAFISKAVAPYYSTAKASIADNAVALSGGLACGASDSWNYGFFNANANAGASDSSKYFVTDATSTPPSSDYPSTSSVDTLFGEMTSGNPSKSAVDSLNTTALDFLDSSTASPGF